MQGCLANTTAESKHTLVDNEGNEYDLHQEMCDYNMDRLAIAKDDMYIENDEGGSNG
jgi:hypothetical protein